MNLFHRRTGGQKKASTEYRWAGKWVAADADGLAWEVASSPDGQWAILTRDSDDSDEHIGYREAGPGRYRLVEGSATRCEGRLLRPNDAKVANDGTFLVADWLFGDDLKCRICIFDQSGAPLIDATYGANVASTCISDEGRYAAVHLASNPDRPEFDELVTVWDLRVPARLWSKPLEGGRAEELALDPTAGVLRARSGRMGWVAYRLSTGTTDVEAIRESLLGEGDGFEILDLVEGEISAGPVSAGRADILTAACESAAAKLVDYPRHQARALRVAGDIAEARGDREATLRYWDRALALDDKVGVAKRARALRTPK